MDAEFSEMSKEIVTLTVCEKCLTQNYTDKK